MNPIVQPKWTNGTPLSKETIKKLEMSEHEVQGLAKRTLSCPYCGHRLKDLFSDISGHIQTKCNACKAEFILNLSYFRKKK